MVLRLLFCQEACECDNVCVDLLRPASRLLTRPVCSIGRHCRGGKEVHLMEESQERLRPSNKGMGTEWFLGGFWLRKNGMSGIKVRKTILNGKEYGDITRSRSVQVHETESECRGRRSCSFCTNWIRISPCREERASQQLCKHTVIIVRRRPSHASRNYVDDPRSPEKAPLWTSLAITRHHRAS